MHNLDPRNNLIFREILMCYIPFHSLTLIFKALHPYFQFVFLIQTLIDHFVDQMNFTTHVLLQDC